MKHPELRPFLKFLPIITAFSAALLLISMALEKPPRRPLLTSSVGALNLEALIGSVKFNPCNDCDIQRYATFDVPYTDYRYSDYYWLYSNTPIIKSPDQIKEKPKELPQSEPLNLPFGWAYLMRPVYVEASLLRSGGCLMPY